MRAQDITADDGLAILQLEGELDLANSPELRRLLEIHAKARRNVLVLDLTKVSYVDSSGLATLVEYCRKAQAWEGRFAIFGLSERVRTIFEIVRLDEFLGLYATVDEARAAVTTGSGNS